jgi:hypothetical protein
MEAGKGDGTIVGVKNFSPLTVGTKFRRVEWCKSALC